MPVSESWLPTLRGASYVLLAALVVGLAWIGPRLLRGQEGPGPRPDDAPRTAPAETTPGPAEEVESGVTVAPNTRALEVFDEHGNVNLVNMIISGGWFMVPIIIMSVVVVAIGIERGLSLRDAKVLPPELVDGLGKLSSGAGGFDPREAYKLCQRFPSVTATVIQDMLVRVGRPHSEVEQAVQESSQREAERLYSYVRWLNLATAITPLLGLLGTVWGIMFCFHEFAHLKPGQEKIAQLSSGIMVALITTVGGLVVAIPSSILAHYYEGRIQSLMHEVQLLLSSLMPAIEPFEGRLRFGRLPSDTRGDAPPRGDEPAPERGEPRPAAAGSK